MTIPFKHFYKKIDPNKLFLIDSLGALLTAFILGLIFPRLEGFLGIPPKVLYALSLIAFIFFIYSLLCFAAKIKNWRVFMKTISIANLAYCCLTIGLIITFYQTLSILGILYFLLEILIIIFLSLTEMAVASNQLSVKN